MKPIKLLPSLPPKVRDWAENLLRRPVPSRPSDLEIRNRIERLATWPDLSDCWAKLGTLETKYPQFNALEVAYRAVGAPSHWKTINKARRSEVERDLSKISKAANKLAGLLSEHRDNLRYWVGSDLDTAALLRNAAEASSEPLVVALYETEVETTLRNNIHLQIDHDLDTYFPRLHEFVYEISKSLKLADETEELLLRPTRSGDSNARRTYTIRVLSHYFLTTTLEPHHKEVATIAYVIFEGDESINDTLVRENTRDLLAQKE